MLLVQADYDSQRPDVMRLMEAHLTNPGRVSSVEKTPMSDNTNSDQAAVPVAAFPSVPADTAAEPAPPVHRRVVPLAVRGDRSARLSIYVNLGFAPTSLSVNYEVLGPSDDYWVTGPEDEFSEAYTEALGLLVLDEASVRGEEAVFNKRDLEISISSPSFPNYPDCRVVVTSSGKVRFEEHITRIGCPGQPGWYQGSAFYNLTALALALAATVLRQSELPESERKALSYQPEA
jgi:hypothetical protein